MDLFSFASILSLAVEKDIGLYTVSHKNVPLDNHS